MYRCMYGGHSVLRSNSKLHDNFGKMETHTHPRMSRIILVKKNNNNVINGGHSSLITCMRGCKESLYSDEGVVEGDPLSMFI